MSDNKKRYILTGLMGTIAFHLIILVIFLSFKLGRVKQEHKESLLIEFAEEDNKSAEDISKEKKPEEKTMEQLSEKTLSNIASNTEAKMEEQVSTEKYIKEVMEELGMEEINQQLDNTLPEDVSVPNKQKEKNDDSKKNSMNFGKTRITYNVPNRVGRHIERPIYRCQGGGEVVIDIVVDQSGAVVQASIQSSSTNDICVKEMALESARNSYFNSDYNAPKKVRGSISYIFVPQ
jgi:outer membrane biosynthesis protein TonB